MNTKVLSQPALDIIEQYKNVPYFNNKTTARRGGLRVEVGKGSPKEIYDEVKDLSILQKVDVKNFTQEEIKKFMVSNNIGIDCSGLAFYILNEESVSRGKGSLSRHLRFQRFLARFRPVENINVLVFSDNKNSKIISIQDAQVGDIITMVGDVERNHILIIHQIEYQNSIPITLHYTHSVAWPTDGEFGHGMHQGKIEIVDTKKPITEQRWIELDKTGEENYTHMRALKSTTELRRLNWFN